jgi:hypothetical protein
MGVDCRGRRAALAGGEDGGAISRPPETRAEDGVKSFDSLTIQEMLALAISLEEEDERVYADFADGLRADYPATAAVYEAMRAEETTHRRCSHDLYRQRFGEHIPLVRRQDVRRFRPAQGRVAGPAPVPGAGARLLQRPWRWRRGASTAAAAGPTTWPCASSWTTWPRPSAGTSPGSAACPNRSWTRVPGRGGAHPAPPVRAPDRPAGPGRAHGRQRVHPAPVFAAAKWPPGAPWEAFRWAWPPPWRGHQQGFAEALSDDGSLSPAAATPGCGSGLWPDDRPWAASGTPCLSSSAIIARPIGVAFGVVALELAAITWVRSHYMDTRRSRPRSRWAWRHPGLLTGLIIGGGLDLRRWKRPPAQAGGPCFQPPGRVPGRPVSARGRIPADAAARSRFPGRR